MTTVVQPPSPAPAPTAKGTGITLLPLPDGGRRWVRFVAAGGIFSVLTLGVGAIALATSNSDSTQVEAVSARSTAAPARAVAPALPAPAVSDATAPAVTDAPPPSAAPTTAATTAVPPAPPTPAPPSAPPSAPPPTPAAAPPAPPPPPPPSPPPSLPPPTASPIHVTGDKHVVLRTIEGENCSEDARRGIPTVGDFTGLEFTRDGSLWTFVDAKGNVSTTTSDDAVDVRWEFPPKEMQVGPTGTVRTGRVEIFTFRSTALVGVLIQTYEFSGTFGAIDLTGQQCVGTFDITGNTNAPIDDAAWAARIAAS